jgi:diaminopimelate decarboxylase
MFERKEHLCIKDNHLYIDGADSVELAEKFGTPLYVSSEDRLRENIRAYRRNFPDAWIYFAVKANGNLAMLRILAQEGAGADIFSGGELLLAILAGMPKEKILFNGNSKRDEELEMAVKSKVTVSADSREEAITLSKIASHHDETADVIFRVNPDISVKTHPKIATGLRTSKFGIPSEEVVDVCRMAQELDGIRPIGLHCHIGSQILDIDPFEEAAVKMMDLAEQISNLGVEIEIIDLGGGLGIQYEPGTVPQTPSDLADRILPIFKERSEEIGIAPRLVLEPGRSIAGDTTILLTKVNMVKRSYQNFVGVDAGFNLLCRPMVYDAYHHAMVANKADMEPSSKYTIVGPICETGDILARDRKLPEIEKGDLIAILDTGAYGYSMGSQYNGQPRCAEVLVKGKQAELTRRAEDYSALLNGQTLPARLL